MSQSNHVWQEWFCTNTGGGCGGYILVKLNTAINGVVEMVCPKCGHKHQRCIENGAIREQGRFSGKATQEICPTMAAYSTTPRTKVFETKPPDERNGSVIKSRDDLIAENYLKELKKETWLGRIFGLE